jgi:hypothetical protein
VYAKIPGPKEPRAKGQGTKDKRQETREKRQGPMRRGLKCPLTDNSAMRKQMQLHVCICKIIHENLDNQPKKYVRALAMIVQW